MKPLSLFRDAVRAKEIVSILVRYGFARLLEGLETPAGWISRVVPISQKEYTTWQRIRMVCEDLGPTFVKAAQILSNRPDLLPQALIVEFQHLQSHVKPESFEAIREVIDAELSGTLEDHFSSFDPSPIGSGSIAQVHVAQLKSKEEKVAVKIQRPGIRNRIQSDLEIMNWLARELHQRIDYLKPYNLPSIVQSLKRAFSNELDFSIEARNAQRFNAQNPIPEKIFAPDVQDAYVTSRLMVSEYIDGSPLSKASFSAEQGKQLAEVGGQSIFHQIVINGFFHADPHPGNILICEDERLCLIDWGLAGQLTRTMRYTLADMMAAVNAHDAEKLRRLAIGLNRSLHWIDDQKLEMEIRQVLDRYGRSLDVKNVGRIIMDLLYVFGSNDIDLSRDYTLLAKAVISIDHSGHTLNPDFNIASAAQPYLKELMIERWNPAQLAKNGYYALKASLSRLNELPADLQRVLRRMEQGDIDINLHHRGFEHFENTLNSGVNRLVIAIILGALIMGSSMVITTGVEPRIWGYPAVGLIGYLLSAVLGIWIVFDILRHGRHK